MYIQKIERAFCLFVFLFSFFNEQTAFSQTKDQIVNLVWQGVGGRQGWNEARYFMFSCSTNLKETFSEEHSFLWDRSTGACRFEGTNEQQQKVIVLFNTNNDKGKVFIDNKAVNNKDSTALIILPVKMTFDHETFWLFPPKSLTDASRLIVKDAELIGSTRYNVAEVQQFPTDTVPLKSKVYIDTNTGRIFQWLTLDEKERVMYKFLTSGFKDVGGGLLLPTVFIDAKSGFFMKFPIVSALINIESDKLSKP
ncbi:hypothetical protein [Olivibacter sp. XZL3]|uniref:hypothetical protein n=1 Tax=Olivibacter sp. XZL3 TaxID=1735116 RepID=UPI001065BB7F|nr:hypothetical protein [Olivibacter sp. XZL3]